MLLQSPSHRTYLSRQVARSSNSASLEIKSFFAKWRAKSEKQKTRMFVVRPQKSWRTLPAVIIHQSYHEKLWIYFAGYAGFKVRAGVHSRSIRRWLLGSVKCKLGKVCNGHSVGNELLIPHRPSGPRQVRLARAVAKEVMSRDCHIGAYVIVFQLMYSIPAF
jgi:hypothetical protein